MEAGPQELRLGHKGTGQEVPMVIVQALELDYRVSEHL